MAYIYVCFTGLGGLDAFASELLGQRLDSNHRSIANMPSITIKKTGIMSIRSACPKCAPRLKSSGFGSKV